MQSKGRRKRERRTNPLYLLETSEMLLAGEEDR
jgi:hypothetical protein